MSLQTNILEYKIKIYFNKKIDELLFRSNILINDLIQEIFNKYSLNHLNYLIFYKNTRISINDYRKISSLFKEDKKPYLFIISTKEISPDIRKDTSIKLKTNMTDEKIIYFINKFFEYKSMPLDANIFHVTKGIYKIRFRKPLFANEFIQFFNLYNKSSKYHLYEINYNPIILNPLKLKKNISKSAENILEANNKRLFLNRVISTNNKSDLLSQQTVTSGINIYHNCLQKKILKNPLINKKINYSGIYSLPYLNPDEKYYREKYLDKKKWINKKDFYLRVGNYKMGENNFISNYVAASPSEPPVCHNFREIHKDKWISKKGFI